MTKQDPAKLIQIVSFILILICCIGAVPGFAQSHHQLAPLSNGTVIPYGQPVFSDFDRDNKVDRAELASDGGLKRVLVSFGKSSWLSLPFESAVNDRGRLFSGDVDHDGAADLIWISQTNPQKLVMWLGDGQGNFSLAPNSDSVQNRVEALLGAHNPGVTEHESGSQLLFVVPTIHFSVPGGTSGHFALRVSQPGIPTTRAPVVQFPFLSVLQKRGPPSKLS